MGYAISVAEEKKDSPKYYGAKGGKSDDISGMESGSSSCEHVDQKKMKAEMKCGVPTILLPKAEKAKPRKIAVNVN